MRSSDRAIPEQSLAVRAVHSRVAPQNRTRRVRTVVLACALLVGLSLLVGCKQKMGTQPRYEPLSASGFFDDGSSARQLLPDTVARGSLRADEQLYTGKVDGQYVDTFPFTVDRAVLNRGQQRFNIYCAACHGEVGDGNGLLVHRGFLPPPSFHQDALRNAPVGLFYDVITNGFGAMPSYNTQISVQDRWAIIAYVRALQLSQNANVENLPPDILQRLQSAGGSQ